jgi:hypothetical protein
MTCGRLSRLNLALKEQSRIRRERRCGFVAITPAFSEQSCPRHPARSEAKSQDPLGEAALRHAWILRLRAG